jgi:2-C-methyl-D-erythritol 4-phosphate cytidylyltransferase
MPAGPPIPPHARAVLVAAGRSTRMREAAPNAVHKPLIEIGGRTILEIACAALHATAEVTEIVVVAHPDDRDRIDLLVEQRPVFSKVCAVVKGGKERADSVRIGARAGESPGADIGILAVHDAARPFVTPAAITAAILAAAREGAALIAIPVQDTVKRSEDGRCVASTLDREPLWLAQTPQCFHAKRFLELLERAEREGFRPTDDSALWERYVGPVAIVPGEKSNAKITGPEDLALAQAFHILRGEGRGS